MSGAGTVLVFDPDPESRRQVTQIVNQLGLRVASVTNKEEAATFLDRDNVVAALVSDDPRASQLGKQLTQMHVQFGHPQIPVALMVSSDNQTPSEAANDIAAEGFLRLPLSRDPLENFISMARQIRELRQQLRSTEKSLQEFQDRAKAQAAIEERIKAANGTEDYGFHAFDDVKNLLSIEVKRAKRYGYPVSILMIGLDPIPGLDELGRPSLPRDVTAAIGAAVGKSLRAIDLPILYADDRILLFLPHTDIRGAEEVGLRIKRRVRRIKFTEATVTAQLSASVGITGIANSADLTFAQLVKDSLTALRVAQLKGGNRIIKKISRPSA